MIAVATASDEIQHRLATEKRQQLMLNDAKLLNATEVICFKSPTGAPVGNPSSPPASSRDGRSG